MSPHKNSLLKVSRTGQLITPNISKPTGEIAIHEKEWEEAVKYTISLDTVAGRFAEMMKMQKEWIPLRISKRK